ncbi:MAG: ParB/RepB/Spo0J family partition protein [Flavobacteriales bacterium]|nr:ParB/RepB/Spo0J family partition protein [Flavobacteriales bacterium]
MKNKKRALGKGLSALLDDTGVDMVSGYTGRPSKSTTGSTQNILIVNIEPNPFQPRTEFDKEALDELSETIKEYGVIQPITLRKTNTNQYQIISGERRWRASQLAGLQDIPAYVRVANDSEMLEMALVENIQRRDLNSIEIGISYQRLIDECELTHEVLSQKVGKNRSTITNYLRLLNLPAEIQKGLLSNIISMGHARTLLGIEEEDIMLETYRELVAGKLSVRSVEQLVKDKKQANKLAKIDLSSEDVKISDDLKDKFNTKVILKRSVNGKGSIVIHFKSDEDLNDIINKMDI